MRYDKYRDSILACWNGKNIGGTLGAPFECLRGVFNVDYYTQELNGEPLPNDDLDIQLVWLNALEKYGTNINSHILADYWLGYIIPNWSEYGIAKNNLRRGLVPPLSGSYNNCFCDSCGSFILSELWACLMPGTPELAVKYAYEDASVDHCNEGVYAEIFTTAVQSAAFVEKNKFKLIDIGLSYIPDDCGVRKGIDTVIEAYRSGLDWKQARKKLFNAVPGSFGAVSTPLCEIPEDEPVGNLGYDAPSNIGIIIIGWLYGEDDFSNSICIATNCGEDADCTAGTLGAILGIVGGMESIPRKWLEPLGGKIKTSCINYLDYGLDIPQTVEELTERVLKLGLRFQLALRPDEVELCDDITVGLPKADKLKYSFSAINNPYGHDMREDFSKPYELRYSTPLFNVRININGDPTLSEGEERKIDITVTNNAKFQQWINIETHTSDDLAVTPKSIGDSLMINGPGKLTRTFTVKADENFSSSKIKFFIYSAEHISSVCAELMFFRK